MNAKLQISKGIRKYFWFLDVKNGRTEIIIENNYGYPSRKAAKRAAQCVAKKFGLTITDVRNI